MTKSITTSLDIAEKLCKHFEGLSLAPYLCPAGVPTIGYGSTFYEDGTRVTMDDPPITEERALRLLRRTLESEYLPGVLKASPNLIRYPEALGALTDFAYNLGVPRYRASTLKSRVNEEDWKGAREEIVKWRLSNGKVLAGLVKRREAEKSYLPL